MYCGNLANLQGLADTVDAIQPDVIVNAAAYTAVDKAETDTVTTHVVTAFDLTLPDWHDGVARMLTEIL